MIVASVMPPSLAGSALATPAAAFLRTRLLSPGDALSGSASRSAGGCRVARGGGGARRSHISFAAGGGAVGDAFVVEGTTNVKFSRELMVPGSTEPLIILGTGYREKFFVKVYAAAFYVDYSIGLDTEKWRQKVGIETFDASTVFSSIFKAPIVKSLSITLVRDVDGKTFVKALDDVIARRIKKPTVEEESSLSTFRNIFLGRNLKQGTSIYLTWSGPSVMLDLPGVFSDEELSRHMHLKELNDRPYRCQAVSAYDGRGIKSGIDWLVEQMERSKRTEVLRERAGVTGQM